MENFLQHFRLRFVFSDLILISVDYINYNVLLAPPKWCNRLSHPTDSPNRVSQTSQSIVGSKNKIPDFMIWS
jgi:hypothetical protein